MFKWILLVILLSFVVIGIGLAISGRVQLNADFETANRSSANLAPAITTPEAVIQVYAARAFNWRGLFSEHTWVALKSANSNQYQVLQVLGWRQYSGLPVVWLRNDVPDRSWFGNAPRVILDVRGAEAQKLIPKILVSAKSYPYQKNYYLWPDPTSNTFTAYIARQVPELRLVLPGNAMGKDFLPQGKIFAKAPSGTGYQISLFGLLAILLAKEEGLEVNILGFVFGVNPWKIFLDWPMIGRIGF